MGEAHHFLGEALGLWQAGVLRGRFAGAGEHHIEIALPFLRSWREIRRGAVRLPAVASSQTIGCLLSGLQVGCAKLDDLGKGGVIPPARCVAAVISRSSPQRGQQAGLRIAGVRQLDFVTEHAAGTQEFRLRGDDVEARIH